MHIEKSIYLSQDIVQGLKDKFFICVKYEE